MIKVNHVSKRLGEKLVLNDVSLTIEDGIIFGLIGANGAGKSTLLRTIAGIYKSELGCIFLDNEKVYDNPACKKEILLISDEPYFFFNASLRDMKEFYKAWYPQLDEALYEKYIQIFHLDDKKPMSNYSKGMKRQGFIILGLAIAPKYLLLDEAFDGLDPMMRMQFKQAIAQRIEEKQMSVIISSHNLKEMEDLCDSYGMLDEGVLDTSGNVLDAVDQVHKYQMAFREEKHMEDFAALDILSLQIESRVVNIVVRGNQEKIEAYLRTMEPLLMEVLPVNLEEIFIYEVERKELMRHE